MSRSLRRHHQQRMKLRFRKRNKQHPYWADGIVSEGIYASCKCTCSCWMCGNPRKYFGKVTVEEQSQNEIERLSELNEVSHCQQERIKLNCGVL